MSEPDPEKVTRLRKEMERLWRNSASELKRGREDNADSLRNKATDLAQQVIASQDRELARLKRQLTDAQAAIEAYRIMVAQAARDLAEATQEREQLANERDQFLDDSVRARAERSEAFREGFNAGQTSGLEVGRAWEVYATASPTVTDPQ